MRFMDCCEKSGISLGDLSGVTGQVFLHIRRPKAFFVNPERNSAVGYSLILLIVSKSRMKKNVDLGQMISICGSDDTDCARGASGS